MTLFFIVLIVLCTCVIFGIEDEFKINGRWKIDAENDIKIFYSGCKIARIVFIVGAIVSFFI